MAVHGSKTGIRWNAIDVSSAIDKASLDRTINTVMTTAFGSSAEQRQTGVYDVKIPISGPYDGSIVEGSAGMETDFLAGTERAVKLQLDKTINASATNPAYTISAKISDFKMDSGVSNRWSWSATLNISSGTLARAISGAF